MLDLGINARDKQTGFKGLITACRQELGGYSRYRLEAASGDSEIKEVKWFDAQRVEPLSANASAIQLTPSEIQSGTDRVRWAEGLIRQLPENHEGRNSWLLNYGRDAASETAQAKDQASPKEAAKERGLQVPLMLLALAALSTGIVKVVPDKNCDCPRCTSARADTERKVH